MFTLGVRFYRVSLSSTLLMLGYAPAHVVAAHCDPMTCLTTSQANVVVNDGSTFSVGTGGLLSNSTVSAGFIQILDTGQASGITVDGNGWLRLDDAGSAFGSVVESGNMVVVGSATALRTIVNGGDLDVAQSAVVTDTQLKGGAMWVYADATANNTRVSNSGMTVYQNGHADRTTLNEGGELSVDDRASVSNTVVNQGALMQSVAGTQVHFTTVNRGGLMVLGDRAEAHDTTLNTGGSLQLKGDALLGGVNHIDGQVAFADPAVSGFHTLAINGPLTGNGTFLMSTDLASLRGDVLKVQGPISGSHTLVVADSGTAPSGVQQPLRLVAGSGGSGDFKLYGETVDAGAYRYTLQQQDNHWYLAKPAANLPDSKPELPASPPTTNPPSVPPVAEPSLPVSDSKPSLAQPQTLSKGANAAVASHAASAALIDAQMNATSQHLGELRSGKDQGGLWTRGYGTEQRLDTGASRAFEQHVNGMEIGADKAVPLAHGTLFVGGLLGQGQGRQQFGEASKGTLDSTTLGGYASYLDHRGWYVEGALKYSRLDNEIDITSNLGDKVKARYKNHALSADVQAGKAIDLGHDWFVEPHVGLQVARISGGRYTASNGLHVEQDSMLSVQTRVGGTLGRTLQMGNGVTVKPYGKAAWITEQAGNSQVTVNGAQLDSRLPGSRTEIGGGIAVSAADKHSFLVEAGYSKGRDIEQPWAVTVGYRYSW